MIIWVAIYSTVTSVDFIDEVIILYGSANFWASVLISVILALSKFLQMNWMIVCLTRCV